MKKVLFITCRFPFPPLKGDQFRTNNFLRFFSGNYLIDILTFIDKGINKGKLGDIKSYTQNIYSFGHDFINKILALRLFYKLLPLQVLLFYNRHYINFLKKHAHEYEYIYLSTLRLGYLLPYLPLQKTIVDYIDSLSLNMRRRSFTERNILLKIICKIESLLMQRYEKKIARCYPYVLISSDQDQQYINSPRLKLVPLGIDMYLFNRDKVQPRQEQIDILFYGNMRYYPNQDAVIYFIENVYTKFIRLSELSFYIVGVNPPSIIQKYTQHKNIYVTGYVEDVKPYLKKAKVVIAPMVSGSGNQFKIIEAMAMECAVITSEIGNKGLHAKEEKEIMIARSPEEWNRLIEKLLSDSTLATAVGKQARVFIEQNYSFENFSKIVHSIFDKNPSN